MQLVGAKIRYIDMQGKPIALEENRTDTSIQVGGASYGPPQRLDPGQEMSYNVDADFPGAALQAKTLREVRLDLSFVPSQFKEEALNFKVSIGGK
jgi:hypothetical protein